MTKRKRFTPEFKKEAVRLLESGDKPGATIARELGIARNQLYKWQEQINKQGEHVFPGSGRPSSDNKQKDEIARLKRELAKAKEDTEILKKAAAFFAKELG
jgi:transposase